MRKVSGLYKYIYILHFFFREKRVSAKCFIQYSSGSLIDFWRNASQQSCHVLFDDLHIIKTPVSSFPQKKITRTINISNYVLRVCSVHEIKFCICNVFLTSLFKSMYFKTNILLVLNESLLVNNFIKVIPNIFLIYFSKFISNILNYLKYTFNIFFVCLA